ncbi:MAG: hypothetical protein CMO82_00355 [Winogradskyella sp.]|nr:hypothetical protein [Winogradskyella sp.]|tara:strand:+ start:312 stop:953 length:642 start_codon:yes stop_codon:yes gene_type:complete
MKLKYNLILGLFLILLTSCLGDKKAVDVSEMGDTSFVNKNFKGNLIDYVENRSACEQMSLSALANIYSVSEDKIHIMDNKKSDRFRKDIEPQCGVYIETSENDYEWLRGSISLNREISKNEFMGEVHEATGRGENWEEAWALQKSMSKSAEWIENLGMAAVWNANKTELKIKFKGYTLNVYPPTNKSYQDEVAKNRDYKNAAIAMAKAAGYIR